MKRRKIQGALLIIMGTILVGSYTVSANAFSPVQENKNYESTAEVNENNKNFTGAVLGKNQNSLRAADNQIYQMTLISNVLTSESKTAMDLINQYRRENGRDEVSMDNDCEVKAVWRALEVSMYYNAMRPNGTAGKDVLFGYYSEKDGKTINDWFKALTPEMKDRLLDEKWKSGWVAVVRPLNRYTYVAINFTSSPALGKDASQFKEKTEYYFDIDMQDKYLNPSGRMYAYRDYKMYSYNKNFLRRGNEYYYLGVSTNVVNDTDSFHSQVTTSSNPKVISVKSYGNMYAKYPGVAKITIKPAAQSGLSVSKTLAVLPGKIGGVKLTAKKKAMKVTWKKTAGAFGYKIYRADSKNGKYNCVKTVSSKTTSFTNKKLKKKKTYYYKVCAFVKSGKSSWNGDFSAVHKKRAK